MKLNLLLALSIVLWAAGILPARAASLFAGAWDHSRSEWDALALHVAPGGHLSRSQRKPVPLIASARVMLDVAHSSWRRPLRFDLSEKSLEAPAFLALDRLEMPQPFEMSLSRV